MSNGFEIGLIGDVVVDISLIPGKKNKLRLGGIVHAARGLWAMDSLFSIEYIAPEYLDEGIKDYLSHHGCNEVNKIGNVIGAPYLFLIQESKEIGNQGYEFVLREDVKIIPNGNTISLLSTKTYSDILLISGNYPLKEVISNLSKVSNLHIDIANNVEDLSYLSELGRKFSTIFLSTSSTLFQRYYEGDFEKFIRVFERYADKVVLKENRGGSRAIDFAKNEVLSIPSQTRPINHSVGVGDVFDATFIYCSHTYSFEDSLVLSAWIAAEYASTTYPDDFKVGVKRVLASNISDLKDLGGVILPWERRKLVNIYIAAPDFDFVDTRLIDLLCDSFKYHNFNPRRPVKENGQMEIDASNSRKQELFSKDLELINECQILVAVLLNNDPGTLIEIGIAATRGIPTIVFDPYTLATNCMLTQLPDLISSDLDEIISEVFIISSKLKEI